MGDYDNSSGCFGSIVSLLLLAFLWPYIIAVLTIYLAYLLFLEVIAWLALHWVLVSICLAAVLALYLAIRFKLVSHLSSWILTRKVRASFEPAQLPASSRVLLGDERIFTPSSDLYCYWCTKKLGLQSWERAGKYYCQDCYDNICKNK